MNRYLVLAVRWGRRWCTLDGDVYLSLLILLLLISAAVIASLGMVPL